MKQTVIAPQETFHCGLSRLETDYLTVQRQALESMSAKTARNSVSHNGRFVWSQSPLGTPAPRRCELSEAGQALKNAEAAFLRALEERERAVLLSQAERKLNYCWS